MHINNYPVYEKYGHISDITHVMSTFLDWLETQKGLRLCEAYKPQYEWYTPICGNKEELLLQFFGINLADLENEKWQMRKEQKDTPPATHAGLN